MAKSFTPAEWRKVLSLVRARGEDFGLPERRADSVVLGSFNIRKLGAVKNKSAGTWEMLSLICERFDLLAIQEVQDDLEGLTRIKKSLGGEYGMVASDITGSYPGQSPPPERLAFLFRWDVVARTEIASDISFDRGEVIKTLHGERDAFHEAFESHAAALEAWEKDKAERKLAGKKARAKPVAHLPAFVTFIRQPSCVTFRIASDSGAEPYEFLAVNAHLLFGKHKDERYNEFLALIGWLVARGRQAERLYHKDIILFGDLNLDFDNPETDRDRIDTDLRAINKKQLRGKKSGTLYLPFLDPRPGSDEVLTSNARLNQTYDQIALVARDPRLPTPAVRSTAGQVPGGFDFNLFNFVQLFAQALHGKPYGELSKAARKTLIGKFEHDLSDHMPIWIRLPKPA